MTNACPHTLIPYGNPISIVIVYLPIYDTPPEMHGITLLFLPNALSVHANVTVWLSIAILRVGPFLCGYQWLANC